MDRLRRVSSGRFRDIKRVLFLEENPDYDTLLGCPSRDAFFPIISTEDASLLQAQFCMPVFRDFSASLRGVGSAVLIWTAAVLIAVLFFGVSAHRGLSRWLGPPEKLY